MEHTRVLLAGLLIASAGMISCGQPPPAPPQSREAYARMDSSHRMRYPRRTIVLHNAQRVLDGDLPAESRIESLELLDELDVNDRELNDELAGVLADAAAYETVQSAVLEFLLARDYPGLARHAVAALDHRGDHAHLEEMVTAWLASHPAPEVLAEVVKLWSESSPDSDREGQFRELVELITGEHWREALLYALAARGFTARGSAWEVLRNREDEQTLRSLISSMETGSEAIEAMRLFLERFDYLPEDREALLTIVTHTVRRRDLVDGAARLQRRWALEYGYEFRLRDFHLMSRLAGDPLRSDISRTHLVLEIGQAVNRRRHAIPDDEEGGSDDEFADSFWMRLDSLDMADLWRLHLLDEMLSRPRVRIALRQMARLDREDIGRAWGGLVVYKSGQAEAILYPGERDAAEWRYVPGDDLLADQRDSLCLFHAHFSRVENIDLARPRPEQLREAGHRQYDALLLTSIDEDHFSAHYYNAEGTVVSLGIFSYGP